MNLVQWKQIEAELKGNAQLTGSLELSGSFFLNNVDILNQIEQSGIFRQTGSFWATTNDLQLTGSLDILLPVSKSFGIANQDGKKLELNQEGVLVLAPFYNTPTPVSGGVIYSGSNEFFLGL